MSAMDEEDTSQSPKRGGLFGRLFGVAGMVGETIARTVESAGELVRDADLRRKGAQAIAENASKGLRNIQYGEVGVSLDLDHLLVSPISDGA
jgi:hypothetical protein